MPLTKNINENVIKNTLHAFIILLLTCFITIEYTNSIKQQNTSPTSSDYYKFYLSGKLLINNKSMYWARKAEPPLHCNGKKSEDEVESNSENIYEHLHPNLNPPFFGILTSNLSRLEFKPALAIWSTLSLISGLVSVFLITRTLQVKNKNPIFAAYAILGFFIYFPTLANFSYGQVSLYLLLGLTLSWLSLRQGKKATAGVLLSLIISIKPFTGLFLLTLFFFRQWKTLAYCIGTLVILFIASLAFVTPGEYTKYTQTLTTVNWLSNSWNASAYGYFSRIFGGSNAPSIINRPELAKAASLLFSFVTLIALYKSGEINQKSDDTKRADSMFSTTIPAMLLISPLGWIYYFPLLIISYTQIIKLGKTSENNRNFWLLSSIPLLLTATPSILLAGCLINTPKALLFDASLYFYTLLTTFIISIIIANKTNHFSAEDSFPTSIDNSRQTLSTTPSQERGLS